ncbi:MAG: hypothetical protein A3C06_01995 [Candidatus Taylorbacteria bacterium RIFCSPHIGHO2_02_FULL_46_13]|uniref:Uncharacterized protein n=1 Tax=Candidatus Taylorbacteria bacterium RIFCSPHIGHO2_02_FULL_46_13 TaxID=1802312 RepID=A0A1G2MQ17_9BACT|nr:MAG: hypothetical protein A3C06_01995 [Candidatus Taylorbacteria bacterium RIFCSPHIGHO2_02_FULL_46_13]
MPVTAELTQYVIQARASGLSDDAIRAELLKAGWNPTDVDAVVPPSTPLPPLPVLQPAFTKEIQGAGPVEARPRRSHLPFVITVILLLLVGGAVYYFLPDIVGVVMKLTNNAAPVVPVENLPANNTPAPAQPITTNTDTTGWQTYHDDKYGFEFMYPPTEIHRDVDIATYTTDAGVIVTSIPFAGNSLISAESKSRDYTDLPQYLEKVAQNIRDVNAKAKNEDYRNSTVNIEKTILGGQDAYVVKTIGKVGQSHDFFVDRGSYLFHLNFPFYTIDPSNPDYQKPLFQKDREMKALIEQMITTIKFFPL